MFVQAEDGIRDLVRSRGLGDVYKRQAQEFAQRRQSGDGFPRRRPLGFLGAVAVFYLAVAVSYTHLTLPTSDLV